jgi:predicted small secreted protein
MNHLPKPTFVTLGLALLLAFAFTGCNTMRGLGQDTERVGEKIQEKASR